jgi:hypothetical protein
MLEVPVSPQGRWRKGTVVATSLATQAYDQAAQDGTGWNSGRA